MDNTIKEGYSMIKSDEMVLGLLKTLENEGVCFQIRKKILDDKSKVESEHYDTACNVFNETSEEYFLLGFETCRSILLNLCTTLSKTKNSTG